MAKPAWLVEILWVSTKPDGELAFLHGPAFVTEDYQWALENRAMFFKWARTWPCAAHEMIPQETTYAIPPPFWVSGKPYAPLLLMSVPRCEIVPTIIQ